MRFYVGNEKVVHNGKTLLLSTSVKESDLDCIKPLLDCISGLEIWEDETLYELTSLIEAHSGLLPFDVMFLTNFCEYVESHEGNIDIMEIAIWDFRLILAKFDDFNSLFVEGRQLKSFLNALATNKQGRYTNKRGKPSVTQ